MADKPACILITGMGHTATRLLVEMLAKHPAVDVPFSVLNGVQEYYPLHQFFVQAMDNTPLYSDDYWLDEAELAYVLEAYMQNLNPEKSYFVLKQPYYPLYYLDFFQRYFENRLYLIYTERPVEKVVKSWLTTNDFFFKQEEILRQPKKLPASQRQVAINELAQLQSTEYLHALFTHCQNLRDAWNTNHPELPFIHADMEQLATSRSYLQNILHSLDLSDSALEDMLSLIDHERLIQGKSKPKNQSSHAKNVLRAITPPIIWQWLAALKKQVRQKTT